MTSWVFTGGRVLDPERSQLLDGVGIAGVRQDRMPSAPAGGAGLRRPAPCGSSSFAGEAGGR
jgi:hypothetical protein